MKLKDEIHFLKSILPLVLGASMWITNAGLGPVGVIVVLRSTYDTGSLIGEPLVNAQALRE